MDSPHIPTNFIQSTDAGRIEKEARKRQPLFLKFFVPTLRSVLSGALGFVLICGVLYPFTAAAASVSLPDLSAAVASLGQDITRVPVILQIRNTVEAQAPQPAVEVPDLFGIIAADTVAAVTGASERVTYLWSGLAQWYAQSIQRIQERLVQESVSTQSPALVVAAHALPARTQVAVATAEKAPVVAVKSAARQAPKTVVQPVLPVPAAPPADYVTQASLTAQLQQTVNSLRTLIYSNNSGSTATPLPQYIAAGGNGTNPYAASGAIKQLSGVSITNSTVDSASLPDLSGSYVSTSGGTTTTFFATTASTTNFYGAGLIVCQSGNVLTYDGLGHFGCAVDATGAGSAFPFTVNVGYNSTTTPIGLFASTTIGDGTQAGGLTVNGGATTTGNVYFVGNVGIGSTTPYAKFAVSSFSSGAGIVVDALSGFVGNLFDLKLASTTKFSVNQAGDVLHMGSSTLQNFTALQSTSTNATSTSFFATTASSTNLFAQSSTIGSLTLGTALGVTSGGTGTSTGGNTNGVTYYNGTTLTNSKNFSFVTSLTNGPTGLGIGTTSPYAVFAIHLTPTASSTSNLAFAISSSTATFATTSLFSISNAGLATLNNLIALASSTLQNFTALQSTSTNATSTSFFASTASSTSLFSQSASFGSLSLAAALGITSGGTGTTTAGNTNGVIYYDGSTHTNSKNFSFVTSLTNGPTGLGIGTTSPYAVFAIHLTPTASSTSNLAFAISSSTATFATTSLFSVDNMGNLAAAGTATSTFAGFINVNGTGTNSTSTIAANLWVKGTLRSLISFNGDLIFSNGFRFFEGLSGASTNTLLLDNAGGNNLYTVDEKGNFGIGTTTPAYPLDVFSATTSGPVANFTNANGNCTINPTNSSLSCSSDRRLKQNIEALVGTTTFEAFMQLRPVTYNWLSETTGTPAHTGFIAQEVQPLFPDLVSSGQGGLLTLNYAGFIPYLVSVVKDVAAVTGEFRQTLIAWLGNAQNGITKIFAGEVHTQKLCVGDGSGGETCVTKAQLDQLLASAGQASNSNSQNSNNNSGSNTQNNPATPDTTPPTITVTGANPATVSIGATYADLGATVSDNVDQNLGYQVSLDGGATTSPDQLSIDTSAAGTHTIIYSATDQAGNVGYASREVDVVQATSTTP